MRPISSTPRICGRPRPASPTRFVGRDPVAGVRHLDGLDAAVAELADVVADRDALEARSGLLLDDERGDALLGPGDERHQTGPLTVGDPCLRAVDDVLVAVAHGLARDVARVAAGIGLGERQRARAARRLPATGSQRAFCASSPWRISSVATIVCVLMMPVRLIQP